MRISDWSSDVCSSDLADVDTVMEMIRQRPPIVNLMATIALEHYTAMLAAIMLTDPAMYEGAEPEWGALWQWHAIEEIEHKGVAYDTWLHATSDWSRWRRWKADRKSTRLNSSQ